MHWQIRDRTLNLDRPLVMGILNITPDSFSDGGRFRSVDDALRRAEEMISEGADIIDVGGESTRPGSRPVSTDDEIERVVPIVKEIKAKFDIPISIDTHKSPVAFAAVDVGAAIVNDISAFRFDPSMAKTIAELGAGVVLMHSRGTIEALHTTETAENIFDDVSRDFRRAVAVALAAGVNNEAIALDVGIGFGKTLEQNLALIAGVGRLIDEFRPYPFLIGTSRKSFIGKLLGGVSVDQRLEGSLATAVIAVWNGVKIVRTHDIKETLSAIKIADALCPESSSSLSP